MCQAQVVWFLDPFKWLGPPPPKGAPILQGLGVGQRLCVYGTMLIDAILKELYLAWSSKSFINLDQDLREINRNFLEEQRGLGTCI